MNLTQAQAIFSLFEELKSEMEERVPKEYDSGKKYWDNKPIVFHFDHFDFEDMRIVYSRYVGCGENEYHYEKLDLENIF